MEKWPELEKRPELAAVLLWCPPVGKFEAWLLLLNYDACELHNICFKLCESSETKFGASASVLVGVFAISGSERSGGRLLHIPA